MITDSNSEVDCGVSILPCTRTSLCSRLATRKWFFITTAVPTALLYTFEYYLKHIGHKLNQDAKFDSSLFDIFLSCASLVQVITAILVVVQGRRAHSPLMIGGTTIFLGLFCLFSIVPFRKYYIPINTYNSSMITKDPTVCVQNGIFAPILTVIERDYKMGIVCSLYLVFIIANTTNIIHMVTYLVNHSKLVAFNIAIIIAIRIHGEVLLQLFPKQPDYIWISLLAFGLTFLVCGSVICLFPRRLVECDTEPSDLQMCKMNQTYKYKKDELDEGFIATLQRIISNKLIVIDTISLALTYVCAINFTSSKNEYARSKYYINPTEDLKDIKSSIALSNQFKNPIILFMTVLLACLFSNNNKKKNSVILGYLIGFGIKMTIFFLILFFMDCKLIVNIAGSVDGTYTTPACSQDCRCSLVDVTFEPVCLSGGDLIYFSPCHAGCKVVDKINDVIVYRNCTCGVDPNLIDYTAPYNFTLGRCGDCFHSWNMFQLFSILVIGGLVSMAVPHAVLIVKNTLIPDRAITVGFVVASVSILQVPGKYLYKSVTDLTCLYWNDDNYRCKLHSRRYPLAVIMITVGLLLLSSLLALVNRKLAPSDEEVTDLSEYPDNFPTEEHLRSNGINEEIRPLRIQ